MDRHEGLSIHSTDFSGNESFHLRPSLWTEAERLAGVIPRHAPRYTVIEQIGCNRDFLNEMAFAIFRSEAETSEFRNSLPSKTENIFRVLRSAIHSILLFVHILGTSLTQNSHSPFSIRESCADTSQLWSSN
jgi:hypothetical protein